MTTSQLTPASLDRLARRIADDGIDAHHAAVARAVNAARCEGLRSPLLAIVTDAAEPAVARERAFGRFAVMVAAAHAAPAAGPAPELIAGDCRGTAA